MSVEKLKEAMTENNIKEFKHFLNGNEIKLNLIYTDKLKEINCIYMLGNRKLLTEDVLIDPFIEVTNKNIFDTYIVALGSQGKIGDNYDKLLTILHGNLPDLDDYEICEIESSNDIKDSETSIDDNQREIEVSLEKAEIIGVKETSVREQTLDTAKKCVMGDREQDYGTPESNFATIASFWSDYLDMDISAQQVANMMILMKISRIKNGGGTGDSYVDIAGYAACGNEILSKTHK